MSGSSIHIAALPVALTLVFVGAVLLYAEGREQPKVRLSPPPADGGREQPKVRLSPPPADGGREQPNVRLSPPPADGGREQAQLPPGPSQDGG
ncbi:MAG: hypothetical protein JXA28_15255, partial [Bacteroidetes bacterium]|nr:hypothetical protein [Bacteroidota bacterium]